VPPGISRQIPQDLVQVDPVELDHAIAFHRQRKTGPIDLLVLRELVQESLHECAQPHGVRLNAVAPIEFKHVLDHSVEPLGVVADDPREPFAGGTSVLLEHQFRGVRQRGQRIADLVRDVRGEAAERRELHLAGLVFQLRDVLEVDHCEAVPGHAGFHESRTHEDSRIGESEHRRGARPPVPPVVERACEVLRVRVDLVELRRRSSQQSIHDRIVLPHQAIRVDHQHAVLNILDDELVDAQLIGEVDPALARDALVGDHALGKPVRDEGRSEVSDAEQPGGEELGDSMVAANHPDGLLEQNRNRRERGVGEKHAAPAHQ
jgi:hypothetical protein